jgi:hypothetical protein
MLIIFFLVLLFVFLLLVIGGTTQTRPVRQRSRPSLESTPKPRAESPLTPRRGPPPRVPNSLPEVAPRHRLGPERFQPKLQISVLTPVVHFESVTPATSVTPMPLGDFFQSPPPIVGRENIKWDALCRLTGQPHRICLCNTCEELRSTHGPI